MARLLMLKGLPASGKSTFARELVGMGWVEVNKDTLRKNYGEWSKTVEKLVLAERDALILDSLNAGKDVVSSDTNLAPYHEKRLRELAAIHGATFDIKSFIHVPIETCIERDKNRTDGQVGEAVIRKMAKEFGLEKQEVIAQIYVPDRSLPKAVICDLDGTLALHQGRNPFDYDKCDTDLPNEAVLGLLWALTKNGTQIIYLSGREASCFDKTLKWLEFHLCPTGPLRMRDTGDHRKDCIVKLEIFDRCIRDHYNVLFTLDDRDQVVKLWRDMGLTCLQVNYGAF